MFNLDPQKLVRMTNEEIFKEEKKFRALFISFFSCLCVLTIIFLAAAIVATVDWKTGSTWEKFDDIYESSTISPKPNKENFINSQIARLVIQPYVVFIVSLVMSILFPISLFKSYKDKDFSKISLAPMLIVGLIAFFSVINLIMSGIQYGLFTNPETSTIIMTVATLLTIPIWFFISRHVSLLKKCCMIVKVNKERMEFFQGQNGANNQYYPNPQDLAGSNNPIQNSAQVEELKAESVEQSQDPINDKYRAKLEKLSIEKIRAIAEKLSISGSDKMNKEKLIETLIQINAAKMAKQKKSSKDKAKKSKKTEVIEEIENIEIDKGLSEE